MKTRRKNNGGWSRKKGSGWKNKNGNQKRTSPRINWPRCSINEKISYCWTQISSIWKNGCIKTNKEYFEKCMGDDKIKKGLSITFLESYLRKKDSKQDKTFLKKSNIRIIKKLREIKLEIEKHNWSSFLLKISNGYALSSPSLTFANPYLSLIIEYPSGDGWEGKFFFWKKLSQ